MLPNVSAILLAWRRPRNTELIVQSLATLDFIDEILVWRNDPSVTLTVESPKARVIDSPTNVICHGRYLCAAMARNPLVYVQDDDVLVNDVRSLVERFHADPTRIHFNLSDWHFARRLRHYYGESHSALIGWGAVFQKDWIRVLDHLPESVRASALFKREADKYFTLLQRRHHIPYFGDIQHLDGHSTPNVALWRAPEHSEMSALAVREALGLARRTRGFSLPPLWHVVVTCHNYGRYLAEAVNSVMLNDADYEVTIVDDASTDNTANVIADLRRRFPQIHVITHTRRSGVSRARNEGISTIDSAFVALLDADDRFGPDYLFAAGDVLCRDSDIVNPDAILFDSEAGRWQAPETTTLSMLLAHNSIHYCAGFRRSWWSEIGGFDEYIDDWEDYDFWIRAVARGARVRALPGEHFFYRRHQASRSTQGAGAFAALRAVLRDKHRYLFDAYSVSA